ncbi:MAG: LytTR family transcriptional regulator [Chitinophagales bacterium]|nr:LytTR family transcriptional regulator [Chitinophagales bacterium]
MAAERSRSLATLASATKALPKELFIKIHRSFVVSVLHVKSIHKDHVEVLGAPVPVARQYYAGLMKRVSVIRQGTGFLKSYIQGYSCCVQRYDYKIQCTLELDICTFRVQNF